MLNWLRRLFGVRYRVRRLYDYFWVDIWRAPRGNGASRRTRSGSSKRARRRRR